ncbi:MAG: DUF1028 domain-containing protein [Planctomycetota bacterium]|nr:MAG: DUF1028 domain-containing protein [Planctomycetota bacterium]
MPSLLRNASAALACAALSSVLNATWSVVVVDLATGEVCIASATCIESFNLKSKLPALVPAHGAGAAQSLIDLTGQNRLKIWKNLQLGKSPQQILDLLAAADGSHQARQYGIVDFDHDPVTFTGNNAGEAKEGVAGSVGTLKYAIQGNVLTGDPVVYAAETALLATNGSLAERVLAAMEAARSLGGDGRCSCSPSAPTSCGVPPPSFTKTAHCGFMLLARHGDTLGLCTNNGCATGSYYLDFNVAGLDAQAADPDPVFQLAAKYAAFHAAHVGHPDHLTSSAVKSAQSLVADDKSALVVTVELRDLEGTPIGHGGAALSIAAQSGPSGLATVGTVADLGDGRYQFELVAGASAGEGTYAIRVDDGTFTAQLYPALALRVDALAPLHCGFDGVSAAAGAVVPLQLNAGASLAGQTYLVLASASGTVPGLTLQGGVHLPLNADALLDFTVHAGPLPFFPGGIGTLDADGRASAALALGPGALAPLAGARIDFAALVRTSPLVATNAAGFEVLP